MKKKTILSILSFIVIVFVIINCYVLSMLFGIEDNQITYDFMEKPEFLKLIENNNEGSTCWINNTYQNGCYNCVNFTESALIKLNNNSYEVWRVEGETYRDNRQEDHRWLAVKIYIEPTTGTIITPDKLKEEYTIQREVKVL